MNICQAKNIRNADAANLKTGPDSTAASVSAKRTTESGERKTLIQDSIVTAQR